MYCGKDRAHHFDHPTLNANMRRLRGDRGENLRARHAEQRNRDRHLTKAIRESPGTLSPLFELTLRNRLLTSGGKPFDVTLAGFDQLPMDICI